MCFSLAARQRYPWQSESSYSLPGSANSVCRQFLRCVLHRLAAHNMFFKLFQTDMDGEPSSETQQLYFSKGWF